MDEDLYYLHGQYTYGTYHSEKFLNFVIRLLFDANILRKINRKPEGRPYH